MVQDKIEKEMQKVAKVHWQHFLKSYFLTLGSYETIPTDRVSVYKAIHHVIEGLDAHFNNFNRKTTHL